MTSPRRPFIINSSKGGNYFGSADLIKQLILGANFYLRFNKFAFKDDNEIQRFLTYNDISKTKTVREVINCHNPETSTATAVIDHLDKEEYQGLIPTFKLEPETINILKIYNSKPKTIMFFITTAEENIIGLDDKISDFTFGTISTDCEFIPKDTIRQRETIITPNFNGVIICINLEEINRMLADREEAINKVREKSGQNAADDMRDLKELDNPLIYVINDQIITKGKENINYLKKILLESIILHSSRGWEVKKSLLEILKNKYPSYSKLRLEAAAQAAAALGIDDDDDDDEEDGPDGAREERDHHLKSDSSLSRPDQPWALSRDDRDGGASTHKSLLTVKVNKKKNKKTKKIKKNKKKNI